MPLLTERAISNFALLVTINENGLENKTHQAKKQFSILCTILEKAMHRKDHNTAWIIDKALRSMEVESIRFKRPKRFPALMKKIAKDYGLHDRLYAKHIYKCVQAHEQDDKKFIPAATVLDIHLRRSQQYRKSMKQNRCKQEWINTAKRGTKMIEDIVAFYKITLGKHTTTTYQTLHEGSAEETQTYSYQHFLNINIPYICIQAHNNNKNLNKKKQ